MIEVYRDKQEDMKIDEIAQKHGIAGGSVSNYGNKVAGKIAEEVGLQYEKFRAAKLKETYPNAEIQIAKDHSKQPDIILKFPDRIEYHSLKVRKLVKSKATETMIFKKKFSPEYKAALKNNGKMFIDFYNVVNHTHSVQEVDLSRINEMTRVRLKHIGEVEILY